jgi:hypothetical protein
MSKTIDTTQPLSDEDRAYMMSRGREAEVARIDEQFAGTEVDSYEVEVIDEPYEKWKVEELRDEVNVRNLDVKADAKKADLIKALEQHDKANPA